MIDRENTFSSFSVDDMDTAREFYSEKLGILVSEGEMGTHWLHLNNGHSVLMYPKASHTPATFTILNFLVSDIEEAVDQLSEKGVQFERYEEFDIDEKGIMRGEGPLIAWFTDPAGNILSLIEE